MLYRLVAEMGWLLPGRERLPILVPAVAMPTPRLCLWMLYLISHVWNSNYVTSQHRVAMTAGPTFPWWLTPWWRRRGSAGSPCPDPHQILTPNALERGGQECGGGKHLRTSTLGDGETKAWVGSLLIL